MKMPQQLPAFAPPPITAPLVQKDSTAQKSLIDKILNANKAFNIVGPPVVAPTSLAPTPTPPPAPVVSAAPSSAQENAVQKTLQAMGFGNEAQPAPVSTPAPAPAPVAAPTPPPTPSNPLILSSPQAPAASTAPLAIETSTLAPPPQALQPLAPKEVVAEKPKEVEQPKAAPKPKAVVQKADESPAFSIETTKLDVDEKDLGIKTAQIPKKTEAEEKKPVAPKEIKEQKLTSKQSGDKEGSSFTIETTSMEAEVEAAPKPAASSTVAPKPVEKKVEKKVEVKLAKKAEPEPADFRIETTTATPQMMKALLGDTTPDEPEPVEAPKAPEAAKVAAAAKPEPPKAAKASAAALSAPVHTAEKKSGLQGAKP
jgi:hypothetical protein